MSRRCTMIKPQRLFDNTIPPPDDCGQGPSKRRKQRLLLGSSDRVALDVGGTRFAAAASTLTSNSSYFASLLSDNWSNANSRNDADEIEIFLDQDPAPFGVLLAYMRRGTVRVDDVTPDALSLAEFLGMERLLLAVKVRWYRNIGRGPVVSADEDVAGAFDQVHGGVRRAASRGLFPSFLRRDDINAEKDLAVLTIFSPDDDFSTNTITVEEVGTSPPEQHAAQCLVGALNGLHLRGYATHEAQLDKSNRYEEVLTFSRRRHVATGGGDATDVLIPTDDEADDRRGEDVDDRAKQFAMLLEETDGWDEVTVAPAEFADDPEKREDPFGVAFTFGERGPWLERNGFATREGGYEDLFGGYLKSLLAHHFPRSRRESFRRCRIYSRRVERARK